MLHAPATRSGTIAPAMNADLGLYLLDCLLALVAIALIVPPPDRLTRRAPRRTSKT